MDVTDNCDLADDRELPEEARKAFYNRAVAKLRTAKELMKEIDKEVERIRVVLNEQEG
jgi:hypothetical protein